MYSFHSNPVTLLDRVMMLTPSLQHLRMTLPLYPEVSVFPQSKLSSRFLTKKMKIMKKKIMMIKK
jgi:hypothetical protein